jgi:hypothetical protein
MHSLKEIDMNQHLPRLAAAFASVAISVALAQGVASLAAPNGQTAVMVAALGGRPALPKLAAAHTAQRVPASVVVVASRMPDRRSGE